MKSRLTPSRQNNGSPPLPKLDPRFDGRGCSLYPWDDWERLAISRGLDAELAGLGRALIREAFNHDWEDWLQHLCGWDGDGQALLAFALQAPDKARWCFSRLMETDGLRGDAHPETKEWTWGYLKPDMRRVLSTLRNGTGARSSSAGPEAAPQH